MTDTKFGPIRSGRFVPPDDSFQLLCLVVAILLTSICLVVSAYLVFARASAQRDLRPVPTTVRATH